MNTDIIVVGGGMAGITLALSLAKKNFNVVLLEKFNISKLYDITSDGRASALSLGSKKIFEKYGLWSSLEELCGSIDDILITDGDSKQYLFFDGDLVEEKPLGFMIENINLLKSLHSLAPSFPNLKILDEDNYTNITETTGYVKITTKKGYEIKASLLIAADGKNSEIRTRYLNIETQNFTYNQSALVCNVAHELDHQNIAQEKFHQNGPFAILPLKGGFSSSIVWTEKDDINNYLQNSPEEEFLAFLQEKFTDYLGKIELISARFSYKLYAQHAKSYFKNRVALLGDSAHFVHPIAGQGFNLAMRDIDLLVNLVDRNINLGLDIASHSLLSEYEKTRRADNNAMLMITDSLNRLFSNNFPIISSTRRIGLSIVNEIRPLQKFFMKYAMGLRS